MATRQIPIKDIRLDGETQQRPVEDKVVLRYAGLMHDGVGFPPVEIITDGKSNFLWDGFHRLAAAVKLGKTHLEANIVTGTQREAIHQSFAANKKNAVPRPDGTVKKILKVIWKDEEWRKVSVSDTARHVGCTRAYVINRFAEFDAAKAKAAAKKQGAPQKTPFFPAKPPAKTVDVKRGDSTYQLAVPAKPAKPVKPVLDATGKQVPEHLVKFFERTNEYRQMIKQLNDMLKAVRKGKEAGDLFYRYIKIENLTAEVGNVKRIFRFAVPYAICGYCGGDENNAECRACDGCGFVNELTFKATPKDLL